MRKLCAITLLVIFIAGYIEIFAQTQSRTSTTGRTSSSRSRTGTSGTSGNYDTGGAEVVVATVANMLRHPNKEIRMQAVQSLVGGMTLGTTTSTTSSSGNTGIGDLFGMRGSRTTSSGSSRSSDAEGLGTTVVIPEFFTMLADPDPEIRDFVSIALDQIFGTDTSLLKFMNDPDPVVRKYAIRLFVIRAQESDQYRGTRTTSSSGTQYTRGSSDILIMRILLNMAKDPDPDVKKVAEESLEKFISDLEQRYQRTTGQGQSGMTAPGANYK